MAAYYNEIDAYAAQWLRNLIEAGHIAPGEVDTRSIVDVRASDIAGFTQCHFFAGLGGWSGALRLVGFPDDRAVWTGSCPCQPFSLAGKQKGFADDRHLWPIWRELIAERRPTKVYGEQVASAAQWLGLVRGDLEALDYAVGAIPVEAAGAGADHLRDRFWFVGDSPSERSWAGLREDDAIEHGNGIASASGIILANAHDARSQGRQLLPERADQQAAGPDGLAYADEPRESEGWQQRSRQLRGAGGDPETCNWVIGADGKARRVKSGVRLLAHGVPARVAKLRALGNAIDLRPAAAFIRATM